MELASLIYPAPKSSYTLDNRGLVLVPKFDVSKVTKGLQTGAKISDMGIPCMYLPANDDSSIVLLYFHANAEDINLGFQFIRVLRDTLDVHVLSIEYPGYGQYEGKPSEDDILKDAETVYDFLTDHLKIPQSSIHIFGRSLGTGPSVHLSSIRNPGSVTLMSAYLSIRQAGASLVGSSLYINISRSRNDGKRVIERSIHELR